MHTKLTACRICGNTNLQSLLHLGDQCLTGQFPLLSHQQLSHGPLELVKCMDGCGLVQLGHNFDLNEMYGAGYGYRSGLNQSMISHLKDIVRSLIEKVGLRYSDLILDIGCNDGTLLSHYPIGIATLVGMDPSSKAFKQFYSNDIHLIVDFFSADLFRKHYGDRKAKIVTSIAMFYDLPNPLSFMQDVASILADDGVWFFEQSYLPSMLKNNSYDTICHEHLEYYCISQIQWMCERSGLKIVDLSFNNINGGSFAVTVAKKESKFEELPAWCLPEWEPNFMGFAENVIIHRLKLIVALETLKAQGKLVLGYGASTKGNTMLQYCGITPELLPVIADVNEDKWGHYTPGTNILIVPEDKAKEMKPDYFLVFPWHFRDTIIEREKEWIAQGGKFIFPLPEMEIYPK